MYTLVQHSGYGYGGDDTFSKGIETRAIPHAKEADRVRRNTGYLFDTYTEAEAAADRLMYPESNLGLIPRADVTFSTDVKVDGLRLVLQRWN